ncbi:Fic family protein [Salinibacterium sp. SWN248]|uniref:Fic family protein n=1 Tax=Salinibacterium sp. SWN248 TaxID=2792056 RepID=UPI001E5A4D28|nr:Fic family protein [Salinibacterium sp. SWN248]
MTWQPAHPYNELPELPPSVEIETKRVLKAVIEARTALATLDQAARRMTNPTVLINSIPLLEAQASSEIENIVTTTDDIFRFAQDESAATNPATKETLKYRTALFAGIRLIASRPLSSTTAVHVCTIVNGREMDVRRLPGTYIGNPATGAAIYTPPSGETVIRDKLGNWESFLHESRGLDPLVVMAIAHYQFEAIHPFEDGNGRTGRILNVLMLMSAGLIDQPILYLSRYIIENKDKYYRLLLEVTRDGNWEEWILFVLEGIRLTALSTVSKIDRIQVLQDETLSTIREITSAANADLLAVLFEQPYCRIANVVSHCRVSRPTATNWLNALVREGVLVDVKAGRERLFINSKFFELLMKSESAPESEQTLF